MNKNLFAFLPLIFLLAFSHAAQAQKGLWTSTAELLTIPMSGPAWDAVKDAANHSFRTPNIDDYDDAGEDNTHILAAAIVYARTGEASYKSRVVSALDDITAHGYPGGDTLGWARNVGALALAADLVDYRTPAFEQWLKNMAEVYVDSEGRTVLQVFHEKPNNWGQSAFGMLCSVYAYLGDGTMLKQIRDYWVQAVTGPNPGYVYQYDLSWQADPTHPVLINPAGAEKDGLNIDGVLPEELRRAGSFSDPPVYTNYAWTGLQGMIEAARVLDRYNPDLAIWEVGDWAIYRAIYRLQIAWEQKFGGWAATGNDEWMLPFVDQAYGTDFAQSAPHREAIWDHGKNVGFGYVTLASTSVQRVPIVAVDSVSTKRMDETMDNDGSTAWWAKSDGAWIQYDLGSTQALAVVAIAWTDGDTCQTAYDIEVSEDGTGWSLVYSGKSSGATSGFENVDLRGVQARFVRIVGHGNNVNRWTRISEVKIFRTL